MGAITRLADLSEQDRRSLEGWLAERARSWNDGWLDESIKQLRSMPEVPCALLAVALVVKLDLKQQWQRGRSVALVNYLEAYPELGGKSGVAADLIWAEMKAKTKAGAAVDLEDYAQAYPNQAGELRALVSKSGAGRRWLDAEDAPPDPRHASAGLCCLPCSGGGRSTDGQEHAQAIGRAAIVSKACRDAVDFAGAVRPLSHRKAARPGRDGVGLQGLRHRAPSPRGPQGPAVRP